MDWFIVYRVLEYPEVPPIQNIVGMFRELEPAKAFAKSQMSLNTYSINHLLVDEKGFVVKDKSIWHS